VLEWLWTHPAYLYSAAGAAALLVVLLYAWLRKTGQIVPERTMHVRPTFSESWYRVKDLRAKLRGTAQISRQFYRGERWYVVRDPAGNQYHRLSEPAYRFVGLLDGRRTVAEAWELVGGQLADDAPTQNEVIQILSQLHSANLIEADVPPDAAVLLRRHKKMVQRQWQGRLMNILFPRIPLWDADQFLKRWMPVMKYFLSPWGMLLWLVVVVWAIVSVAPRWSDMYKAGEQAIDPANWPFLWLSFIIIKAIHELGHGFICRRFGGEVHEMGVMFLVLVPAPYVEASTAWGFPNKWHRILVGAGGMIFELFVAAIMAFVWLNTSTATGAGSFVHGLAFNIMLIASVSTVLFNANPLLRYDGYYMLSDWLEIPNLRYRSTEYTLGLIKRHLFKVKSHVPLPPVGQRIWLFIYCIASTVYRTIIGILIILMVWQRVPVLGVLMALGGVITWLTVPVIKLLRYLLIEPELHRKRWRAAAWITGAAAVAVIAVGFIPVRVHYYAEGVTEPAEKTVVFAGANGVIERVVAADGQVLKKDDVIAVCSDRELELQIEQLRSRMRALRARWEKAVVEDQAERLMLDRQMRAVQKELDRALERRDKLTVRAPADGMLVAPMLKHMVGKYVREGEELGTLACCGVLRVTASIDQDDAALPYLKEGKEAQVRLAGQRDVVLTAVVEENRRATPTFELRHPALGYAGGGSAAIDPHDPKGVKLLRPHIEVWLQLTNTAGAIVSGQRAHIRFELDRKPLIWNWARRVRQLIQSHSHGRWT